VNPAFLSLDGHWLQAQVAVFLKGNTR
jgi:hypothetical protein